jgi:hypothetical protein
MTAQSCAAPTQQTGAVSALPTHRILTVFLRQLFRPGRRRGGRGNALRPTGNVRSGACAFRIVRLATEPGARYLDDGDVILGDVTPALPPPDKQALPPPSQAQIAGRSAPCCRGQKSRGEMRMEETHQ